MIRTQILLTDQQYKFLKEISREKNVSMAESIRECITYYNANATHQAVMTDDEKRLALMSAAGKFKSGVSDMSKNHDDYLKEYFKK